LTKEGNKALGNVSRAQNYPNLH